MAHEEPSHVARASRAALPSSVASVKLPIVLLWLRPPRTALVHAWIAGPGAITGVNLCGAVKGRVRLSSLGQQAVDDARCEECTGRARLFALALPHADKAAAKALASAKRYAITLAKRMLSA